jgi:hypothetical protein
MAFNYETWKKRDRRNFENPLAYGKGKKIAKGGIQIKTEEGWKPLFISE